MGTEAKIEFFERSLKNCPRPPGQPKACLRPPIQGASSAEIELHL